MRLKFLINFWCARRDCFGARGPSSSASLRTAAGARLRPTWPDGQVVELPRLRLGVRISTSNVRNTQRVLRRGLNWCARRDSNSRPPGS
jgi:hypothetical protein